MDKHLIGVPEQLFELFGEKYGTGPVEIWKTSGGIYTVRNLDIAGPGRIVPGMTNVMSIGLSQNSSTDIERSSAELRIWYRTPADPKITDMHLVKDLVVSSGFTEKGSNRIETIVMKFSHRTFNPLSSLAGLVVEMIAHTRRFAKGISPRVLISQEGDKGRKFVLQE